MSEKHFLDLRGLGRVINKIISKIPTKTSDLINDKYFQTGAEVRSYVNAQSFGKVKNVNTGVGLTGGPITETGTIKANLVSETRLGSASEVVSDSDAKVYPVALDSQGKLSVAVPDTVVGAATESPTAIGNESVVGTSRKYAREDHTHNIDVTTGDANGQIKIAGQNVDVKGLGSIAYKDELVESDIPDLSSTYVKQGSDNDSHVEVTLDTTRSAKAYLLATTTPPTKTPTNVVAKADGSVYLDTKPGALSVGQRTSGNVGTSSFTNGNSLLATGNYSHAEGNWSEARGSFSHAEGNASVARGQHSHAEGSVTETTGVASHAEGNATKASGMYSHAEGEYTEARGEGQHVSGKYNVVDENNTYAEIVGNGDNSTRSNARTLDWNGNATYAGRVTVGIGPIDNMDLTTKQYVDNAVPQNVSDLNNDSGYITQEDIADIVIPGGDSHVEVTLDTTSKAYLLATTTTPTDTPTGVVAKADDSVYLDVHSGALTIGTRNSANWVGVRSFAQGDTVTASGVNSRAEGKNTTASGDNSHAEGKNTTASRENSHAEGSGSTASQSSAHAEGANTTASGYYSHAEGVGTQAKGEASHAEGSTTIASGARSHAEGLYTEAKGANQHASGKYNVVDNNNTYAEIVGNGTSTSVRSNARTLDWSGNAVYAGKVTVGAGPANDMDLTTKQYVDGIVATAPYFGVCSDSDVTRSVTVNDGFVLAEGVMINVFFEVASTSSATLNVNNTGAYPIYIYGTQAVTSSSAWGWREGQLVELVFHDSKWYVQNQYFSNAGTTGAGLMTGTHVTKLSSLDPNSTTPIQLTNQDLDDIHPTNTTWYYAGGNNTVENKPGSNFTSFGMVCFRTAGGYITQLFWPTGWSYHYCRTWNGTSWTEWVCIGREASSSENGLMSATDKTYLDGIVGTQLTNEDLNDIHPGHFAVYWADSNNTCTHKPTAISVYAFALVCLKTTSAYQLQVLFHPTSNRQWRRYWTGSSWSGWSEITYSWNAARTYNGLMSTADKIKLDDLKASTINVTDTYGVAGTAGATVTIQALMDAIASKA